MLRSIARAGAEVISGLVHDQAPRCWCGDYLGIPPPPVLARCGTGLTFILGILKNN